MKNEKQYLSYKELSEFLNVPIGTLYFWVNQKNIPHMRLGARCVRFDRDEIQEWLQDNKVTQKAPLDGPNV